MVVLGGWVFVMSEVPLYSRYSRAARALPLGNRYLYKGTLLIRKRPPPRTSVGPWAKAYCRVLQGGGFL